MAKHYVILDDKRNIIRGFSDEFEQPNASDVCVCDDGGRHFEINGNTNPIMFDSFGVPLYRFDGKQIVIRTQSELDADKPSIAPFTTLDERLAAVETAISGTPPLSEMIEALNVLLGE